MCVCIVVMCVVFNVDFYMYFFFRNILIVVFNMVDMEGFEVIFFMDVNKFINWYWIIVFSVIESKK